jgi:tRNA pseudouridine65 synthase
MPVDLLHVDEDLVVAVKPAGMLMHNSAYAGPREVSLLDVLRTQVPGPLLGIHRLDRGASGVVALGRNPDAVRAAQASWADQTHKAYLALVRGHLGNAVEVDHPVKDENGTAKDARSSVVPRWQSSVERVSLVEVTLWTGRRHQVRLHLRHLSHPIVGDSNYGDGKFNRAFATRFGLKRLMLHACVLALPHPRTGEKLVFNAPPTPELAAVLGMLHG